MEEYTKPNTFKKVLKVLEQIIFYAVIIALILMIVFIIQNRSSTEAPSIFGHKLYIVQSGSMEPTIHVGSLIAVKEIPPKEIRVDDVISYQPRGETVVTHRVVDIEDTQEGLLFTTRGDANNADDPNPLSGNQIIGKEVFAIPYIGILLAFVKTRVGLIIVIGIPITLILLYSLYDYLKKRKVKGGAR